MSFHFHIELLQTYTLMVADVWEQDVWDFQAKSGSSGSCCLFLHFLEKIAIQQMSGKRLEVPDILLPDIRGVLIYLQCACCAMRPEMITQIIRKQFFCVTDVCVIAKVIPRQLMCVIGAFTEIAFIGARITHKKKSSQKAMCNRCPV